jgi:hypothetical protein
MILISTYECHQSDFQIETWGRVDNDIIHHLDLSQIRLSSSAQDVKLLIDNQNDCLTVRVIDSTY